MFDLTTKNYISWLKGYQDVGAKLCRACDRKRRKSIVIRHDIDAIRPGIIKKMADEEEKLGIRSSYYIITDPTYKYYNRFKNFFLELQSNGHEIGLHVNSVELSHKPWRGKRPEEAFLQLDYDIKKMQDDGFDVRTMAAHGINWFYKNYDLLKDYKKEEPIPFNRMFSPDDCIFTDSTGIISFAREFTVKTFTRPRYFMCHPEHFDVNLNTKINKFRYLENLEYEEKCALIS